MVFYIVQAVHRSRVYYVDVTDDMIFGEGLKILLSIIMLGYAYLVHFNMVKQTYFSIASIKWLFTLNKVFVLFASAILIAQLLFFLMPKQSIIQMFLLACMLPLLVLWTYFGLTRPSSMDKCASKPLHNLEASKTSGLSTSFANELQVELMALMENNKPYLNADLQLDDIAQMMNISRHHASQLINDYCHQSFYEFVNGYRVEYAKHLLLDMNKALSIEDVAFQCGFNNRVSFYRSFKKCEGVSPTEFRSEIFVDKS
ncbi:MAG: AraC family transcriptional regulator [Algicola sp.]|nr:AraC family transcriptional regulator [Algicola sp.]